MIRHIIISIMIIAATGIASGQDAWDIAKTTISGKKVEIAVSKILNGEEIDNKDALANPHALDQFYKFQ